MTIRGVKPIIELYINDMKEEHSFRENTIIGFEWRSMINCGFMAKFTINDAYFNKLQPLVDEFYIQNARKKPIPIKFKLSWAGGDENPSTPWRTGFMVDLDVSGKSDDGLNTGYFSFIAVDPISYYLNWGNASGKSYFGKIGSKKGEPGVLEKIIKDYVPSTIKGVDENFTLKVNVDETTDTPARYWMMRQDPKTFLQSLLDWSCPFTKNKTSWIVSIGESDGPDEKKVLINIVESYTSDLTNPADLKPPAPKHDGSGKLTWNIDNKIYKWELYADHMLTVYNNKLVTSGMSASSGQYIDPISDPKEEYAYVTDKNTPNKLRIPILEKQGFTKPVEFNDPNMGWSYVNSIPEFGGAEPQMWYKDYISGRARQRYMEMLPMVMRMKITVPGEPRLFSNDDLGKTKIFLYWPDRVNKLDRMMNGPWVLYGWHHKLKTAGKADWLTDVYVYRIDWDDEGKPGSKGGGLT